MRKIIAYPLSIIHYLVLGILLVVFHVFQVLAYRILGYRAHKFVVDVLNFMILANIATLGIIPRFKGFRNMPKNVPLIIVSNHQSMYDIPAVVWGFRKHHAKFISKKELGKNIPSISYNLNKGGSVLIDRKNGSQSIKEILKLGKKMETNHWSVCIFPEGTRSKTGKLRGFQSAGFKTLLKASPNALIVPMVIDGNYKLHCWGSFPMNFGNPITYTALEPIARQDMDDEALLALIRDKISESLES